MGTTTTKWQLFYSCGLYHYLIDIAWGRHRLKQPALTENDDDDADSSEKNWKIYDGVEKSLMLSKTEYKVGKGIPALADDSKYPQPSTGKAAFQRRYPD